MDKQTVKKCFPGASLRAMTLCRAALAKRLSRSTIVFHPVSIRPPRSTISTPLRFQKRPSCHAVLPWRMNGLVVTNKEVTQMRDSMQAAVDHQVLHANCTYCDFPVQRGENGTVLHCTGSISRRQSLVTDRSKPLLSSTNKKH